MFKHGEIIYIVDQGEESLEDSQPTSHGLKLIFSALAEGNHVESLFKGLGEDMYAVHSTNIVKLESAALLSGKIGEINVEGLDPEKYETKVEMAKIASGGIVSVVVARPVQSQE